MVAALDLDAVEVRGGPLVLASDAEVDELQYRLSAKFPDGYREYVTRLGEGSLNIFVRVLPPWRILAELEEHRGMMSAYWFWESGKVPFGQEQAMESILLADTLDGDVIVFHPDHRGQIIVLPRHRDRLYARGPDLLETINWVCSGGTIRRFGPGRYFEQFDSRLEPKEVDTVNEPPRAGHLPAESTSKRRTPGMTAREVLMAYFAELAEVEAWGISNAGGPGAFLGDEPPDTGDDTDELIARGERVHARYCAPRLAHALRGASVTLSSAPEHDAAAIRVLGDEARSGRVVIRTAEGTDFVFLRRYVLEPQGGEWWITAETDLGME